MELLKESCLHFTNINLKFLNYLYYFLMIKKIKAPILLIFYNRPKKTKKLLKIIEKINFSKVYIKVDGYKNIADKKR